MVEIRDYYDRRAAQEFRQSIPRVRNLVGVDRWPSDDDTYGIGSNTFRGFRDWGNRPSDVYLLWAESRTSTLRQAELERVVSSKSAFERWHANLARSLQRHWSQYEYGQLSVAHKYKLVDLYIKWLARHAIGRTITDGLMAHAYCALDSQVLTKLNECLSQALPVIRPSMGHVQTEKAYRFCQELIAEFTAHCGGTPLLFDYYAWRRGGG